MEKGFLMHLFNYERSSSVKKKSSASDDKKLPVFILEMIPTSEGITGNHHLWIEGGVFWEKDIIWGRRTSEFPRELRRTLQW